ncbi:hypothetical protein [Anaerorhabdus furcosa]|uniref:Uncharacterized protein n=1 Tax=Anaerorhabdus furcosa TaxID=118967 RepID=A0A1T4LDH5_9FIRM|nr:hypothetical protein [Anaerorhabdus furcosa]SJZ52554.1 hypothetical protein SAMN02745191_0833 [Anaerorhabdus furcosa]
MNEQLFQRINLGMLQSILDHEDIRDVVCNPSGNIVVTSNKIGTFTLKETITEVEVSRISNDTHLSERTVRKQLKILEQKKYIFRITRKRKCNGYTSNTYFFGMIKWFQSESSIYSS